MCVNENGFLVDLINVAKCMKSFARNKQQERLKSDNPKESLHFIAKGSQHLSLTVLVSFPSSTVCQRLD